MPARAVGQLPSPMPERAGFDDWVRPHLPMMRRLALVTAVGHDPDDVVQEALLRAWQRRETFDAARGTARSWLLAITADRARRTRLRSPRYELVELDVDPSAPAIDAAGALDVRDAVRGLPRRQRQAVILHYFVGLTTTETGALMGCAPGTVKSTLSDARTTLATTLGDDRA